MYIYIYHIYARSSIIDDAAVFDFMCVNIMRLTQMK